jgi:hypothetical protein
VGWTELVLIVQSLHIPFALIIHFQTMANRPLGASTIEPIILSSNQQQNKNKRRRRVRVTFSFQNGTVREIEKNSTDENAKCWYSVTEFAKMKENRKTEAKRYKKEFQINGLGIYNSDASTLLEPYRNSKLDHYIGGVLCEQESQEQSSSFRGLESIIFLREFSRHKSIYMKTVLKYQRKHTELIHASKLQGYISAADMTIMKEDLSTRLSLICERMSRRCTDKARTLGIYDATGTYCSSSDNKRLRKLATSKMQVDSNKKTLKMRNRINIFKDKNANRGKKKKKHSTVWRSDYFCK